MPDLTTLIPFLNQYSFSAKITVIALIIILIYLWFFVYPKKKYKNNARIVLFVIIVLSVLILIFAYPKHPQPSISSSTQRSAIDKSMNYEFKAEPQTNKGNSLSFKEINEAIENAPPLQRDDVRKNFKGIKVEWNGYLRRASKKDNNTISLEFAPSPDVIDRLSTISCEAPLKEYPELTILPEGTKVRIEGVISGAHSEHAALADVKLFFSEIKRADEYRWKL